MIYKESEIQKSIVNAVRYIYPKSLIFSIPNEGKRNPKFANVLKASGMMHGVSDLIFIHEGNVIFVEVKAEKGKQTEYQKGFQSKVESQNLKYWIVKSADEILTKIKELK